MPHLVGLQQCESLAQRARVVRPDRADQEFASIAEAEFFVPGRQAVSGGHAWIVACHR